MMKYKIINICITAAAFLLCCSCTDENLLSSGRGEATTADIINVGADIEDAVAISATTRAGEQSVDAETIPWLVQPLKKGLDITYGNINAYSGNQENERVAILKLQPADGGTIEDSEYKTNTSSGYAEYTFNYRSDTGSETDDPARWYDNGPHFFEGVHVPNRLRYRLSIDELATDNRTLWDDTERLAAVTKLTTDQHDDTHTGTDNDLGNYTLLEHYLGMPAHTRISATVARIKLPFRHRLCRVLAYILIDPELKTNGQPAKIQGYANINVNDNDDDNDGNTGDLPQKPFRDDPTTSSIRFCNVDVLGGVYDEYDSQTQLHTLTPIWSEKVRKVVPHFEEQLATFNTKEKGDKVWFENSSKYSSAPADATEKIYYNVPVYDLIIRPTYTLKDNVMYDERTLDTQTSKYRPLTDAEKTALVTKTNQIDFTVSLDNGLTYEKHVAIDLDANYQTIVYLRITHEGVDYNESGSERWMERTSNDKWYGVDNQNGNILSQAGSSWQRAYYNTYLIKDTPNPGSDEITDGGFYDETKVGDDGTSGQYLSDATWKKYFLEAHEGGAHHGDYFVLAKDITINAAELPSDGLVFTGHLDGFTTHPTKGYHTITLQNAGQVVVCSGTVTDVLAKLYVDAGATTQVPQLYWMKETAQIPGHYNANIGKGEPIAFNMYETYPKDLEGLAIFTKVNNEYQLYGNRTFYKKATSFLFAGLNGVYETNQERGETPWEANVHKETNTGYTVWLPYRDVTGANATNTGWRAEVLNLEVVDGTLFKEGAVITGNVENCKDKNGKVDDHTPAMPKYK